MLGDQEFQKRAEESITALYEKLGRAADDFDFDVEMNSGALTVELEEPRERFVVSPNAPVRQIWVSAHSRSFKLDWDDARAAFVLPGTGQTLTELIASAIGRQLGEEVGL